MHWPAVQNRIQLPQCCLTPRSSRPATACVAWPLQGPWAFSLRGQAPHASAGWLSSNVRRHTTPSMDRLGILFLPALLAGPLLAALALIAAYRHGRAQALDWAVLLVPPALFFGVGFSREELRSGFALVLWPILLFAGCGYLLAAKILVVDRWSSPARSSRTLFSLTAFGAVCLALVVPQLLS